MHTSPNILAWSGLLTTLQNTWAAGVAEVRVGRLAGRWKRVRVVHLHSDPSSPFAQRPDQPDQPMRPVQPGTEDAPQPDSKHARAEAIPRRARGEPGAHPIERSV